MTGQQLQWIAVAGLALTAVLGAQTPSNAAKPRIAGMAVASEFGQWKATAQGPVAGTGQPEALTIEGAEAALTLPDGTSFQPLAAGTPLLISGDGASETVVPSAVSCPGGGLGCTITADFSKPHPGKVTVSSGTFGLQEAINYMASYGGGVVLADSAWPGNMSQLLSLIKLPSDVLLVDQTAGNWTYYGLGNGGQPQAIAAFSSATGTSLIQQQSLTPRSLNGALFAHAYNFAAIAPGGSLTGGIAATVTPPGWTLPAGVETGDSLDLSGGTGGAEVVTVTNTGTGCPSGTAASLCFTPAQAHSGTWTLASATSGLQEAVNAAGAGGWVVDDIPNASLQAPLVLSQTVRLTGYAAMDAGVGTTLTQTAPNTDVIDIGTTAQAPSDVVIENLMAVGVSGAGTDTGVAIHCLNCAKLKLENVTAKQAHDGVFFDSAQGHAFDATVTASHFIGNDYGIHIVGGSANRLTFVGNTVDGNTYGVFDDGGWVHTWVGNDIEGNAKYGYWQQVSDPAAYSAHDIDLEGNYFENNGSNTAGQGDVFLGQLVGGGSGNNGDGCSNCTVTDNLFNASGGGNVTALSLGASDVTVSGNTYSGYGTGKIYAYLTGPAPNYSHVLSLGDGAGDTGAMAASGAFGGARAGTVTRIDNNGGLTLGGWDQLNDQFGSPLLDTTVESPTGIVSVRGKPGGAMASNGAQLALDADSTSTRGSSILWRNQHAADWQVESDPFAANAHDFCLLFDYSTSQCVAYVNPQDKFLFGATGPTGSLASRTQDFQIKQDTNGDSALVVNRATDTSPTGYLLDLESATLSQPLFRVDATGTVVAGSWNDGGSMTVGPLSATTGAFSGNVTGTTATFSGAVSLGAASTAGGAAINTTAARVGGQSGTLFSSSSFTAGQCLSGGVSFSSGVAIGMAVAVNPETVPPAGLVWNAVIDAANHVTLRVCNATAATIAWSSGAVWDVRVLP